MRTKMTLSLGVLCSAAILAGCSSVPLDNSSTVPVENRTPGAGTGSGAGTGVAPESRVTPVDLSRGANDAAIAQAQRTVYFDFDSYVVKDEYRPVIDRFAKTLTADRSKHVQVEGHTDDRGGSEYNLALGQKRAEAVARSLGLLGVGNGQVEAVSFGKERPLATGSDEASYAKNRRAELNYR